MPRFASILLGLLTLGSFGSPSRAQGDPREGRLGGSPGESGAVVTAPGGSEALFGGVNGPGGPRVPLRAIRPGETFGLPEAPAFLPAPVIPTSELPVMGELSLSNLEDDGPPDGLTLDLAIQRLIQQNLDLRALAMEIPQSQADILTAGLRDNPLLFFGTQLIPYQPYSDARPGGPVQYDLNITWPLDLNHKRRYRVNAANQARRVIEAQYQDAVRQRVDSLYQVFVNALAARETIRFAQASVKGYDQTLEVTQAMLRAGEVTPAEVRRIEIQQDRAQIGLVEAEEILKDELRALAPLLNLPVPQAEQLQLRGRLRQDPLPLPATEELIQLAWTARPDLAAYRLGVQRAMSEVRLARAERFQDVYVLMQPYTFQDNSPFGAKSAHSASLGVTVPLPINNRNQGNIRRAEINVTQTRTELQARELEIASEVRRAEGSFRTMLASVGQIERELLPAAVQVRDESLRRWKAGETSFVDYLNAQREYNDLVRQYRDTLVRYRRGMLALNTAVGYRIMP